MSIFTKFWTSVEHFFESLFSGNKTAAVAAQNVFKDISAYASKALAIVQEVENDVKPFVAAGGPVAEWITVAEKFLAKYTPDAAKVSTFLGTLAGSTPDNFLSSIAGFALSFLAPSGTAANLINLAIETAYGVYKQITTSSSPVAMAAVKPVAK